MRRYLAIFILALVPAWGAVPSATAPAAILIITADQHSAYERTAQVVRHVERIKAENPDVPLAVLIDGDSMELGNVVAQRSLGAIDFAMFRALARLAPTVLNLGNHESEFFDLASTVAKLEATGVKVISTLRERATGRAFAPASISLPLGEQEAVIVGLGTASLASYRAEVRPTLDIPDPLAWGKQNLPALLRERPIKIVLSHAGLPADRPLLASVPDGTLFAGAHNHIRFVHRSGRTVYVHSGSWNEFLTIAQLRMSGQRATWDVEQLPISLKDPVDPSLAALIRTTFAKHITPDDTTVVGQRPNALGVLEAARFAVAAVRQAAKTDAAFIGSTTFGAGLPEGAITKFAFDACVRFDGTIFVGEFDGAQIQAWLSRANQGPDTPFAEREGEILIADSAPNPKPGQRYRVAVTDWVARNAMNYLKVDSSAFTEVPDLKLKAIVTTALNR